MEEFFKHMYGDNPNVAQQVEEATAMANLVVQQLEQEKDSETNAPMLNGRLLPSMATLADLKPVSLHDLRPDKHHIGRAIYLTIRSVSLSNGMKLDVEDSNEKGGTVWSLVEYPFPGREASMSAGTIVAIKEPYFAHCINGYLALCVNHSTDIVRVSRLDPTIAVQFPKLASKIQENFLQAGNVAFIAKKFMDAMHLYSAGIERARKVSSEDNDTTTDLQALLIKHASACVRLGLYPTAVVDLAEVLTADPTNEHALKLMCSATLELDKCDVACGYALGLIAQRPDSKANQDIYAKVSARLQQSVGSHDLGSLARSATRENMQKDAANFVGDIEVRKSDGKGRGLFATKHIPQGQVLLCEKSLVFSYDSDGCSFKHGVKLATSAGSKWFPQNQVSFLHHVVSKTALNTMLNRKLFSLFDGVQRDVNISPNQGTEVFDSYRALNIIKYNSHTINHSTSSVGQYVHNQCHDEAQAELPMYGRGLYYMTSHINHSCMPNATYSSIGDYMIVHATHDIRKNEEITLSYVASNTAYEHRKKQLAPFDFECSCPMCKADAAEEETIRQGRSRLVQFAGFRTEGVTDAEGHTDLESMTRNCIWSYRSYSRMGLPLVPLANLISLMGLSYLGRRTPLSDWPKVSTESKGKAYDCIIATLEVALGIRLLEDSSTPFCELVFSRYSHIQPVGISTLVDLAELAYGSTHRFGRARAAALLRCAKLLYKLCYAEDATFEGQYNMFNCLKALSDNDPVSPPSDWEQVKARAVVKPIALPVFLR